jgi:Nuclease-related domain
LFWNAEPEDLNWHSSNRSKPISIVLASLANYFTGRGSRQVDSLIITGKHVCHVELKSYTDILYGGVNGHWSVKKGEGFVEVLDDRQNPYTQALACKMAISDDMHVIAKQDRSGAGLGPTKGRIPLCSPRHLIPSN